MMETENDDDDKNNSNNDDNVSRGASKIRYRQIHYLLNIHHLLKIHRRAHTRSSEVHHDKIHKMKFRELCTSCVLRSLAEDPFPMFRRKRTAFTLAFVLPASSAVAYLTK